MHDVYEVTKLLNLPVQIESIAAYGNNFHHRSIKCFIIIVNIFFHSQVMYYFNGKILYWGKDENEL